MSKIFNPTPSEQTKTLLGPVLVSLGAFLWATDAVFRSQLTSSYSAMTIVTVTHLICFLFTFPVFVRNWKKIQAFKASQWIATLVLSLGGSTLAMVLFTMAFAETSNYNIPILLQKLQPVLAITLASLVLKERISRHFVLAAVAAIFGAYLVSFGEVFAAKLAFEARSTTVLYTLLAAGLWASCTVASRFLLNTISFRLLTSVRYVIATFAIFGVFLYQEGFGPLLEIQEQHFGAFVVMALIPGLLALFVYYSGMQTTSASLGTLCELAFPLGAVLINWTVLDSALNTQQILGAVILIASVTFINLKNHNQELA